MSLFFLLMINTTYSIFLPEVVCANSDSLPALSESSCLPLCRLGSDIPTPFPSPCASSGNAGGGVMCARKQGPSAALVKRTMACSLLCDFVTHPRTGLPWARWEYMLSPVTMVVRTESLCCEIISAFCTKLRAFAAVRWISPGVLFLFHRMPSSTGATGNIFKPVNLYQKTALLKGFTDYIAIAKLKRNIYFPIFLPILLIRILIANTTGFL